MNMKPSLRIALNSDDEIALVMNREDFDTLFKLLRRGSLRQRLYDKAEVITLEWLDKKRAEFP